MQKIIGTQCRTARSLLKWNVYDLANHVGSVSSRRIQDFEKGTTQLAGWENEDLVRLFTKHGIEFKSEKVIYKSLAQRRKESDVMRGDAEQEELLAQEAIEAAKLAEEEALKAARQKVAEESGEEVGEEAKKEQADTPVHPGKSDE